VALSAVTRRNEVPNTENMITKIQHESCQKEDPLEYRLLIVMYVED